MTVISGKIRLLTLAHIFFPALLGYSIGAYFRNPEDLLNAIIVGTPSFFLSIVILKKSFQLHRACNKKVDQTLLRAAQISSVLFCVCIAVATSL